MQQYRKKPGVVHAHQWDGFTNKLPSWGIDALNNNQIWQIGQCLDIQTIYGTFSIYPGDYILLNEKNELGAYRQEKFNDDYEPVSAPSVPSTVQELAIEYAECYKNEHQQLIAKNAYVDGFTSAQHLSAASSQLSVQQDNPVDLMCMVCGKNFKGELPKVCCSGQDCGCMGQPVDPVVCSRECYDNLPHNRCKAESVQQENYKPEEFREALSEAQKHFQSEGGSVQQEPENKAFKKGDSVLSRSAHNSEKVGEVWKVSDYGVHVRYGKGDNASFEVFHFNPHHHTQTPITLLENIEAQDTDVQQESDKDRKLLKEWATIFEPIFKYANKHPDCRLGSSVTEFVVEQAKKYDQLKAVQSEGGLQWVKGGYDKLYRQVKSGIETPCMVDYHPRKEETVYRDICSIKYPWLELRCRGTGYGEVKDFLFWDKDLTEEQAFIKLCEHRNVEWICFASPSTANTEEGAEQIARDPDQQYTYYQLDFNLCPSINADYTICETYEEVIVELRAVDIDLDDPTSNASVTITGIGMTPNEFKEWQIDNGIIPH
jgi:hypothetical protein